MKNIHVLPTDKPSRLGYLTKKGKEVFKDLRLFDKPMPNILDSENQHIYITSDEEIKEGDWCYYENGDLKGIHKVVNGQRPKTMFLKKIILTTDQDLIKYGVQAIDDEFLKWFVKNPSCEFVEIKLQHQYHTSKEYYIDADYVDCTKEQYNSIKSEIPTCPLRILYKIIIPQEEPKQETLEEAAEWYAHNYFEMHETNNYKALKNGFEKGAKWQAERMYQSMKECWYAACAYSIGSHKEFKQTHPNFKEWFEQFKKKQ
jgi:hypothetical protein